MHAAFPFPFFFSPSRYMCCELRLRPRIVRYSAACLALLGKKWRRPSHCHISCHTLVCLDCLYLLSLLRAETRVWEKESRLCDMMMMMNMLATPGLTWPNRRKQAGCVQFNSGSGTEFFLIGVLCGLNKTRGCFCNYPVYSEARIKGDENHNQCHSIQPKCRHRRITQNSNFS